MDIRTGIIIKALGSSFKVMIDSEVVDCYYRGRYRVAENGKMFPVVGDKVDIIENKDGNLIDRIHPRLSKISRQEVGSDGRKEQVIIANLETAVIVSSIDEPPFKPRLVDRMLVSALKGGLKPIIVLNKIDLDINFNLEFWEKLYADIGYEFIPTSAITGEGMDKLTDAISNTISVFIGHSGVGKSSLLNILHPGLGIATKQVSHATKKGRHTTTSITMYPIGKDAFVADTPGLKELGLWNITKKELGDYFEEFTPYADECKFRDCFHYKEPGCAVAQAVENNKIADVRYESYIRILNSLKEPGY